MKIIHDWRGAEYGGFIDFETKDEAESALRNIELRKFMKLLGIKTKKQSQVNHKRLFEIAKNNAKLLKKGKLHVVKKTCPHCGKEI